VAGAAVLVHDLAMAESQDQPAEVLQARYDRYMAALH
jgi:hypothetical protein